MILYSLEWGDRNSPRVSEWFGTQTALKARKAELNRLSTKRPYDQIEILRSVKVDFPTNKQSLLEFLNQKRVK